MTNETNSDGDRNAELEQQVRQALAKVRVPGLGSSVMEAGMLRRLELDPPRVRLELHLSTALQPQKGPLEISVMRSLGKHVPELSEVEVEFGPEFSEQAGGSERTRKTARQIVAVQSGKGGVGKSTVTVNLAVALTQRGLRVGILDADVYGPNIPMMMGLSQLPEPNGKIIPGTAHGVAVMSMGYLIGPGQSMVWRGPMLHQMVQRLFSDVDWPELDVLLVDLPPGTGDVLLSLSETAGVAAAVVVTSPQAVANDDTLRGISALGKLGIPAIGVVENMAGEVFGSGGGERLAEERGLTFLGRVPLNAAVRRGGDEGVPLVAGDAAAKAAAAGAANAAAANSAADDAARDSTEGAAADAAADGAAGDSADAAVNPAAALREIAGKVFTYLFPEKSGGKQ